MWPVQPWVSDTVQTIIIPVRGSVGKGTSGQAGQLKFNLWNPHGRGRELAYTGSSLNSTCVACVSSTATHIQINNTNNNLKIKKKLTQVNISQSPNR